MSDSPVILFKNVSFAYGTVSILSDVDLTVEKNELIYIVGPNGGGKTTLLKLILGLIQPDTGMVRLFGEPPERSRYRIGYTPQYIHYDPQFPVTVMDIVLMGRLSSHLGGRYSKSDKRISTEALDELGTADLANRLFADLSGGQRQRVLIARSLATKPDLLLLDEPTANVDARTEERLFEVIRELKLRMTILLVSHDLGFVSDMIKSVVCVNRQVVVHPTTDITDESIRDMYGKEVRMIRHDISC